MMSENDLELRMYLEDLGFSYDNENEYWAYYGDLTIDDYFEPDVSIFVDGNLIVDGPCSVKDLIVNGNLNLVRSIDCNSLSCTYLKAGDDVGADNIVVLCDMHADSNVDASNITVYGTISVKGTTSVTKIKASRFNLAEVVDYTSIETI